MTFKIVSSASWLIGEQQPFSIWKTNSGTKKRWLIWTLKAAAQLFGMLIISAYNEITFAAFYSYSISCKRHLLLLADYFLFHVLNSLVNKQVGTDLNSTQRTRHKKKIKEIYSPWQEMKNSKFLRQAIYGAVRLFLIKKKLLFVIN